MPQFKYSLVQKGKLFAKVLEIITICSPAVLLKGLFVMFATSFVYLKGRPILCPDIAFERKPRGLQKQQSCTVTRILRQSQLELNIWTKSKLVKLFVRSVPKEILVSNLIFIFIAWPLLTQHSQHSWPYQVEKSERAIYWKLILCLHEFWWRIANVTSLKILRIPSLKSLRKV